MNPKPLSFGALMRLLAVMVGLTVLVGCNGGSSSSSSPGTPAVSLSASTLTFSGQFVGSTSAAQVVTVTNSGTATLNFSSITVSGQFGESNTCTSVSAGGACTVNVTFSPTQTGALTGTLTLTDNASGSPQTVSLTGTGTSVSLIPSTLTFTGTPVGTPSSPQGVTLNNTGSLIILVAISITTGSSTFSEANNCGPSVAPSGTCTINVTFTPAATGTVNGTLTVTYNYLGVAGAGTNLTVALTGTSSGSNTVSVTVGFGPNGYSNTADSYYNGIFTTVSVCEPGTTTCASVPNVLVDYGSTGLRVLSSAISSVTLPQINDGSGDNLYECYEFGDMAYTWGPVSMANVQIGGETASQVPSAEGGTANTGVPIQVITVNGTAPNGAPCLATSLGADNSLASLGANGILGIGNAPEDCGVDCTDSTDAANVNPYPFILCSSSACEESLVPLAQQPWNPVAAFSSGDNNGELLTLPSIGTGGAATVPGTLIFGIGTQSNNALGSATVYELDDYGNFQSLNLYGVSYTSDNSYGAFLDTGSNAYYVLDPATLTSLSTQTGVSSVTNCADNGYYCMSSNLNLPITLAGSNGTTSPTETLSMESADTLLNSTDAALDDLGDTSCSLTTTLSCGASTDYFDLGLPFFYGKTVFLGITGADSTYPNGFWAF